MTTTISRLRALPRHERAARLAKLTAAQALALRYGWEAHWARPSQREPMGEWDVWLVMAGRGFGKTRIGAEFIVRRSQRFPLLAVAARTAAEARDVCVEGPAGLLACSPPWFRAKYEPSKRRVLWPNGSITSVFTADEPDRARGPQHYGGWFDEIAAWRYWDAWDMLMLGMRLGPHPQVVATTTPRPLRVIRALMKSDRTHVTSGTTYENLDNLSPMFREQILSRYEGTTLGEQELHARILDEAPGALWRRIPMIDAHRVVGPPALVRIVVAVDPAVSSQEGSNETGIVTVGIDARGHCYVLGDASGILQPHEWARRVCSEYDTHAADMVVAESNQGGDLVASNMRHMRDSLPIRMVRASRGKRARAEPVSALYEQGRVHHVGCYPDLEDQLCNWEPGTDSPDRLDALVWGVTALTERRQADISGGFQAADTSPSSWKFGR